MLILEKSEDYLSANILSAYRRIVSSESFLLFGVNSLSPSAAIEGCSRGRRTFAFACLTFGLVASLFGLQSGFINQVQYSVLTGVLIASAVIPTIIAQKWFMPVHSEDLVDLKNGN